MTVTIPDYVTAEGNVKVSFVPAIAGDISTPSTTELNAGEDITCFLPENWGGITGEQAKGTTRRMCSKQTFEAFGRVSRSVSDFTFTYLPQEDDVDAANAAKAALEPGTAGFLAVRYGLPATDAWANGQILDVLPVETGARTKQTGGSDEFAPLTITQQMSATGLLVEDAVVTV